MECDTQLMKSGCTTHASSESSSSWNSKRPRPTLSMGGGDRQHLKLNPNPSNPPKRRKLVRPTFDKPSPSCNAGASRNDGLSRMAAASVPTTPDLTLTLDRGGGGGEQHASKGDLRNDGLFQIAASVPATPDLASVNCNNNKGGFRDGAPLMNMVVTAAPQDTITPDQQAAASVKDKGSRDDAMHPPVPVPDALPTPDIILPPEQQQPLLVSTHNCDSKLRGDPVPMAAADATSSGEEIAPLLVLHNTAIQELRSRAILSMRAVGVGIPSTCAPLSPEPEPEPEPKTETFTHAQRNSCIISQSDHQSSDDLTRAIEEEYAARFPPLLFDDEDGLMVDNIHSDSDSDDDDAFIQRLHAMFHPTSSS